MLDRGRDDVASMVRRCFAESTNGEVVSFRAPGSKDDLVRFRADQPSDLAAGPIDCGASLLAETVDTRRVAEVFGQRAGHRRRDTRVDGRSGAVIQVYPAARGHQI